MKKLKDYHSTNKHLFATKSHLRRLAKRQGTEVLINNIKPLYDELRAQEITINKLSEDIEEVKEDIDYYDSILDTEIKLAALEATTLDLKSGKKPIFTDLFPDGKYSTIIHANNKEELDLAKALVTRIEALGEGHELYPFAKKISDHIANEEKVFKQLKLKEDALKEESNKTANIETSLRKAYRDNYLDAAKQFGDAIAESFFTSNF